MNYYYISFEYHGQRMRIMRSGFSRSEVQVAVEKDYPHAINFEVTDA